MQKQTLENIYLAFIFVLSAVYLIFSLKMPIGTLSEPETGFLPVILGTVSSLLSLGLFVKNLVKKYQYKLEEFTRAGTLRLLGYILIVFLFIATFKLLGFWIIFPVVLFLSKISGYQGWIKPIILSAIVTVVVYVLFTLLLAVPLPKGVFMD